MGRLNRRTLLGGTLVPLLDRALPSAASARQVTPPATAWPAAAWEIAAPADLGFDPDLLGILTDLATSVPSVTGMVVTRHGAIAAEYWAEGWGPDTAIDIRSCTKSFVAALVGRALHDGLLPDLSVTIGDLIPERIPPGADPDVAGITLRSLLTMTSGLQWDWQTDYQRIEAAADPVAYVLGRPIVAPQGALYAYNSGGSHIIGLMVAAAAGLPLEEYAGAALFEPLGIAPAGWRRYPQGEVIGGYGLRITPQEMARLGYLYLRGGEWHDARLIAAEYIAESTSIQSPGDPTGGTSYGYQWWVADAAGHAAYFALGYGGQYIHVVPALDLVVAVAVGDIDVPISSPRPIILAVASLAY